MSHSWIAVLGLCLLLGTTGLAWSRGGPAERAGSLVILTSDLLAEAAIIMTKPHFPTILVFCIDFGAAVALMVIAIRYTSLWLGCAMILESIALCSYGLAATGDGLHHGSYVRLNNVLSFLMLACILAGAIGSWRKRIRARRDAPDAAMAAALA